MDFVVERHIGALVEKGKGPWQRNVVIIKKVMIFLGEDKMKTREWSNLI
jgi:hypothetical protein